VLEAGVLAPPLEPLFELLDELLDELDPHPAIASAVVHSTRRGNLFMV
jgi:hypothetical protein